jgi:hypothetical protein
MNIINYLANKNLDIVFCLVDNIESSSTNFTKELTKNQSDYTISNIHIKGYDIYQGFDEDALLSHVATYNYQYAVVFSTGTEFINGMKFFNEIENLISSDFFLAGHILDRGNAYYELHHQCYVVNLKKYKEFNYPIVGQQELGSKHIQTVPYRDMNNIHDDYTPRWITPGSNVRDEYLHKCHGWNIISIGLDNNLPLIIFNDTIRSAKRHFYPESLNDFQQNLEWIYFRERHCSTEFVHTKNNEWANPAIENITHLVTPASGTVYFELLDTTKECLVTFFDYNLKALDYWKEHAPKIENVKYKFLHLDLLGNDSSILADGTLDNKTLINLSNIFCYEGTMMFSPLSYRVYKENQILSMIQHQSPNSHINFTMRAASGFIDLKLTGTAKDFILTDIRQLQKPTWHFNQDWT